MLGRDVYKWVLRLLTTTLEGWARVMFTAKRFRTKKKEKNATIQLNNEKIAKKIESSS